MTKLTIERLEYYAVLPTKPAERKAIFMYEVRCMARQLLEYEQAAKNPVAYRNKFTGQFFTLEQQPDAVTDTAVYEPVFLAAPVLPKQPVKPVMFIDGDISSDDAEKLAAVIRELGNKQPLPIHDENGLLPCPFCSGKAKKITIENESDPCFGGDVITCMDCGASSHVEYGFKENLESSWNSRENTAPAQPVIPEQSELRYDIHRDANRYRFLRDKDAFGDEGATGLSSWDDLAELDTGEFDSAVDARILSFEVPQYILTKTQEIAATAGVYAELYRLREEVKGPDGFDTWKDAAISEKKKRIEFERRAIEINYLTAMSAFHSDKWHKMDPITGYMHGWNACRDEILKAQPVSEPYKLPSGYALVPCKLTAENGAKSCMIGEFTEQTEISCPECFGDDECETCDGSGMIEVTVPVSWTTIKDIWAKGIEHFAAAPAQESE